MRANSLGLITSFPRYFAIISKHRLGPLCEIGLRWLLTRLYLALCWDTCSTWDNRPQRNKIKMALLVLSLPPTLCMAIMTKQIIRLFVSIITFVPHQSRHYRKKSLYIYLHPSRAELKPQRRWKETSSDCRWCLDSRSHHKTTWVFPLFPPPPLLAFLD